MNLVYNKHSLKRECNTTFDITITGLWFSSARAIRVVPSDWTAFDKRKNRKLPEGHMNGCLREFRSITLYLGETMSRRKILPCSKICRRNWHFLHAFSVFASVNFELCIRKRYAIRLHAYMAEENPSKDCIYISIPVLPGLSDEQIVLSLLAKILSSLEIFAATATFFWTLL